MVNLTNGKVMVFGIGDHTYLGVDVAHDLREYSRGMYEQACPVCGTARREKEFSHAENTALYSCETCKVLWGDETILLNVMEEYKAQY